MIRECEMYYITADPYTFTSAGRLNALMRVLKAISEICNCEVRVVIPTLLYDDLKVFKVYGSAVI